MILYVASLIVSGSMSAQTTMPDSSIASGTWTKNNAPYIIEGELVVPEGATLNIEPGVEVRFKTGDNSDFTGDIDVGYFNVYGRVIASGVPGDSIVFTREGEEGNWGIVFLGNVSDSSIFEYCVFEYANRVDNITSQSSYYNDYTGALSIYLSEMSVQHCCFRFCEEYGIHTRGSTTIIRNNLFTHNSTSVLSGHWNGFGIDTIEHNVLCHNSYYGAYLPNNYCFFSHNQVFDNNYNGIYFKDAFPTIVSNEIYNNGSSGIYFKEYGGAKIYNNEIYNNTWGIGIRDVWYAHIVGNIIYDNQYGIACWDYSRPEILNNTIINNSSAGYKNDNNSNPILRNNVFWSNGQTFEAVTGFSVSNSIMPDSALPQSVRDGKENIFGIYPEFQDSAANDFRHMSGSVAINNGYFNTEEYEIPEVDFVGSQRIMGSRIDIGAFEYQQDMDYLKILEPYYHKNLVSNLVDTLRWGYSESLSGTVTIKYSTDSGTNWIQIVASAPNNGFYVWDVPELNSDICMWLISSNSQPSLSDTSRYCFTISPNIIPHGTALYGTLKSEFSPYHILGEVTVPENKVLSIEPGCEIRIRSWDQRGGFLIYGKLEAIGVPDSRIVFTRDTTVGNWFNLFFYENLADTSIISYCDVEYASSKTNNHSIYYGAVVVAGSKLRVDHSEIKNNPSNGIMVSYGPAGGSFCEVRNCNIYNNDRIGVSKSGWNTTVNLINTTVAYNGEIGLKYATSAKNCIFFGNLGGSVFPGSATEFSYSLLGDATLPTNSTDLAGNIFSLYPQFIDSLNRDFHLRENSPCIDTGDPSDDYLNEPSPNGSRINMGAYGNTQEAASFISNPRIDSLSRSSSSIFAFDTVTIYGAYFNSIRGIGKVNFNGAEALEYLNWSDVEITCIIPPNPSLWADITITNNNGNESKYTDVYHYLELVLSELDPKYTHTLDQEVITLRGKYFGQSRNGTKILFDAAEADSYLTWTDTLIQVTCPPGTEGLVDIVLFNSDSIQQRFSDSFLYTEKPVKEVCGDISGVWSQDTVYQIICPVIIDTNDSLVIGEGVTVIINGGSPEELISITNNGTLIVGGREENPVRIGAVPGVPGKWEGFILNSRSDIQFAEIKHARNGLYFKGGNYHIVNGSMVSHCKENGIKVYGNDNYTTLELTNSMITNNQEWGVLFDAYAGSYDGGSATGKVVKASISENGSGGIFCRAVGNTPSSFGWYPASLTATVNLELVNSLISRNHGPGISVLADGDYDSDGFKRRAYSQALILQSIVSENDGEGILINQGWEMSYAQPEIMNCVIWGNEKGIMQKNGTSFMQNTIVWGGGEQRIDILDGIFEIVFSNTIGDIPGEGNISGNPLFENPSSMDFHLTESSPCIDAGSTSENLPDLDPEGKLRVWDGKSDGSRIVDMGIYEFNSSFPLALTLSGDNPTCYKGRDGSVIALPSGGISPYQYEWNNQEHSSEAQANDLFAGVKYRVKVTDADGTVISDSIVLSDPEPILTQVDKTGDVSCFGESDGSAFVTASNGGSPYSYLWDNLSASNTAIVEDLEGNKIYHVEVSDANGCSVIDSLLLPEPERVILSLVESNNISCFGLSDGMARFSATGGIPPYSFLWSDIPGTEDPQSFNLQANVYYYINASDQNGCEVIDSVILFQPDEITIDIVDSINQFLVARVQGGTPPYFYQWDNENQSNSILAEYKTLEDQYYHVMITDSNECFEIDSLFVQATGLALHEHYSGLRIYPNPTTDWCLIEFLNPDKQEYYFRITDPTGKVIAIGEVIKSNQIKYSFGNKSSGMYFIEIIGPRVLKGIILLE